MQEEKLFLMKILTFLIVVFTVIWMGAWIWLQVPYLCRNSYWLDGKEYRTSYDCMYSAATGEKKCYINDKRIIIVDDYEYICKLEA